MEIREDEVVLDRELSELDKFAFGFCERISEITSYVLVSGYVSILLGRARASEDIDMLVPEMDEPEWKMLHGHLTKGEYYCLNAETPRTAYGLLKDGIAARFAPEGIVIPNMEILLASSNVQKTALETKIRVRTGDKTVYVSDLELQIAYKEKVLGSPKDMEDAKHIRIVLGSNLNSEKLSKYERILDEYE